MMEFVHELFTNDRVAREIGNGIWSIVGFEIILALNLYLWRTWRTRASYDMPWIKRLPVRMAIAFDIYMVGSILRATWVWSLLECQNRTMSPCINIQNEMIVIFLAVGFAIAGGFYLMRLMTLHWGKRAWMIWTAAVLAAIAVPIAVHVLV